MSKQVMNIFDVRSTSYDSLEWVNDVHYFDIINNLINLNKNVVLLDLASGTGSMIEFSSPKINYKVGIDISLKMLYKSKLKNNKNCTGLLQSVGERLPFKESIFDVITCRNGLHHYCDIVSGLNEIKRVIKNSGQIIISETVIPDIRVTKLWKYIVNKKDVGRNDIFYFTQQDFKDFLIKNGFLINNSQIYKKRISISNWLNKSQSPLNIQYLIKSRLRNASNLEKEIMGISYSKDDIYLFKHICILNLSIN